MGYRVRLAGIGFAVLVLVSEVLKGDSPSPNAPAGEILIGASAWASRARRRYAWFSAVVAAAFLVGGASLAREGFFAPDGGYGFILFWLLPLWVVVTSWSPRTP